MIGHEDVGRDRDAVTAASAFQAVEISERIRALRQHGRRPDTARDDRVEHAGEFDAGLAGHADHGTCVSHIRK